MIAIEHWCLHTKFKEQLNNTCVMWWAFIWDKLAYVQVVTNCRYSVAQMCTPEESLPAKWTLLLLWHHESNWAHNTDIQNLPKFVIPWAGPWGHWWYWCYWCYWFYWRYLAMSRRWRRRRETPWLCRTSCPGPLSGCEWTSKGPTWTNRI